jgi:hypothetical protein
MPVVSSRVAFVKCGATKSWLRYPAAWLNAQNEISVFERDGEAWNGSEGRTLADYSRISTVTG